MKIYGRRNSKFNKWFLSRHKLAGISSNNRIFSHLTGDGGDIQSRYSEAVAGYKYGLKEADNKQSILFIDEKIKSINCV